MNKILIIILLFLINIVNSKNIEYKILYYNNYYNNYEYMYFCTINSLLYNKKKI